MLTFRRSTEADADAAAAIANEGRALLKSRGVDQWQKGTYPSHDLFVQDAKDGIGYVVCENDTVAAVCAVTFTDEESYRHLTAGAWLTPDGARYATIHRSAVARAMQGRHIAGFLFDSVAELARANGAVSIRIDTHEQNLAMQSALRRSGFQKCGDFFIIGGDENGDPRWGYEKLL